MALSIAHGSNDFKFAEEFGSRDISEFCLFLDKGEKILKKWFFFLCLTSLKLQNEFHTAQLNEVWLFLHEVRQSLRLRCRILKRAYLMGLQKRATTFFSPGIEDLSFQDDFQALGEIVDGEAEVCLVVV